MAKRKQYDDQFRASAVVMLEAAGYPAQAGALTRVAEHLKVPHPTLSRWYRQVQNPPPDVLVQEKKADLLASLKALAGRLVEAMPDKIEEASLQQAGTVLGIVLDKVQLLEGKATERIEHEHSGSLTVEERASRIMGILDAGRARRTGQSARHTDD